MDLGYVVILSTVNPDMSAYFLAGLSGGGASILLSSVTARVGGGKGRGRGRMQQVQWAIVYTRELVRSAGTLLLTGRVVWFPWKSSFGCQNLFCILPRPLLV